MQFFVSKYLHSIVEGRPPYHPPLGRHPFVTPCRVAVVAVVVTYRAVAIVDATY